MYLLILRPLMKGKIAFEEMGVFRVRDCLTFGQRG